MDINSMTSEVMLALLKKAGYVAADGKPITMLGYATELDSTVNLTHTHPPAVYNGANGFMTGADKARLDDGLSVVTTIKDGLMIAADKVKLDGVAPGANNYVHPANHPPSIITQDATNRFVTDAEKTSWSGKAETTAVTQTANGLMIAADKVKLDGVAVGANNYVHPANHPPSIITQDASNRFVTDTEKTAWTGKAETTAVTQSANGLMIASDKTKLDGIAAGAEVNQNTFSTLAVSGQSNVVADQKSDVLTLAAGTGITITTDATTDTVTVTATGTALPGAHASSHLSGGSDPIAVVTQSANGLMMATDKTKLDGVAVGATNYVHPANHPPSIITQDLNNRFVTDAEKTSWTGKAETTVVTQSANGLMIAADKLKLDGIAAGITGSPAATTLNLGYGSQVVTVSNSAPYNVLNIVGRTLVNLLGRDGNCESLVGWTTGGTTLTVDSSINLYGNNSIKFDGPTSATPWITRSYPVDRTKKYVLIADFYIQSQTSAVDSTCLTYGSDDYSIQRASFVDITKIGKWQTVVNKVDPSILNTNIIRVIAGKSGVGSGAIVGNIDGMRLYEITQTEYDAITSMTADQIAAKYPYVDDVKHVNAPYVIKYGENLLPPFSEWTNRGGNGTVTTPEPYSATIVAPDTTQTYMLCDIVLVSGQQYTLTGSNIRVEDLSVTPAIALAFLGSAGGTATFTPAGLTRIVFCNATTVPVGGTFPQVLFSAGTFTITKPRLNIGAVDKGFEPRNDDYLYLPNVQIASSVDGTVYDQAFKRDGKLWKLNRFKQMDLDGSFAWGFGADYAGLKIVSLGASLAKFVNAFNTVTKYDGKILAQATNTADGSWADPSTTTFYVGIADTDSGWGETYTPTAQEIQAYFYGWRMCDNNNSAATYTTGTKAWIYANQPVSVNNFQGLTNTLPTAKAPSPYTPYKLTYQLATPTVEEIAFEGSIATLEGSNQFEVGTGMIVREKANPSKRNDGSDYVINNVGNVSYADAPLKNKVNRFLSVYKNGKEDKKWVYYSGGLAYGNGIIKELVADYDTTATYEVTYLALDQYALSASVQTINGEYDPNIKTVQDRLVQNLADVDTRTSALENPSTLLAKLKTVDGAGSGLDADTVKGYVPLNKAGDVMSGPLVLDSIADTAGNYSREIRFQYVDAGGVKRTDKVMNLNPSGQLIFTQQGVAEWRLWDASQLRINAGALEYFDGGVWKGVGSGVGEKYPNNFYNSGGPVNIVTLSVYQTLVSITNKGYIRNAYIYHGGGSGTSKLRITVDDVVIFESQASVAPSGILTGITTKDDIMSNGSNFAVGLMGPTLNQGQLSFNSGNTGVQLPSVNAGSVGSVAVLPEFLYFKTNFKLEVQANQAGTNTNVFFLCVGGTI